MPRKDRLRQVAILCTNFARNLAYYRTARKQEHAHLLDPGRTPDANFWRAVNGNFIDICALEWCKLFADEKDRHHWKSIVTHPDDFGAALLTALKIDTPSFLDQIAAMRHYRDKFVAHLDSEYMMHIPNLEIPRQAVWYYYEHLINTEAEDGDMAGLPTDIDRGYRQTQEEAEDLYRRVSKA